MPCTYGVHYFAGRSRCYLARCGGGEVDTGSGSWVLRDEVWRSTVSRVESDVDGLRAPVLGT